MVALSAIGSELESRQEQLQKELDALKADARAQEATWQGLDRRNVGARERMKRLRREKGDGGNGGSVDVVGVVSFHSFRSVCVKAVRGLVCVCVFFSQLFPM